MLQNHHTEFLTGTVFSWHHLLKNDEFKKVITDSFQWLVKEKKCIINAFVIMPNHFHLIWKISDRFERKDVQGALFSFTAHEFKKKIKRINPALLENYLVNNVDREYQFWEREPMIKNLTFLHILMIFKSNKKERLLAGTPTAAMGYETCIVTTRFL